MKRQTLNLNDYQSLVIAYQGESDRSAIVLAGSFAEHYLATYLRHFMIADSEVEVLFERALSTFDARISIAYAFRLISKAQRQDLLLIKNIRNHFAHSPQLIDLQRPDIKAMVHKLSIYKTLNAQTLSPNVQKTERDIFLYSIGIFVAFADNAMVKATTIPEPVRE